MGGKNSKLAHVEDASIDVISNIAVQMFKHIFNIQLCAVTNATAAFQTHHFLLLTSGQSLCLLKTQSQAAPHLGAMGYDHS